MNKKDSPPTKTPVAQVEPCRPVSPGKHTYPFSDLLSAVTSTAHIVFLLGASLSCEIIQLLHDLLFIRLKVSAVQIKERKLV